MRGSLSARDMRGGGLTGFVIGARVLGARILPRSRLAGRLTQRWLCSTKSETEVEPGCVYLVATPIGNLGDISRRAVSILRHVDWIAAEDTRHTGNLLKLIDQPPPGERWPPMLSHHEHNWKQRVPDILAKLDNGAAVAVVSDAGTPAFSDPGRQLVSACAEKGFRVIPIPGPCAAIAALTASGLPADSVLFMGFIPSRGKERRAALDRAVNHPEDTLVIYEGPHRIGKTLDEMASSPDGLASRPICLARELTKKFEELVHFPSVTEAAAFYNAAAGRATNPDSEAQRRHFQGEYTLILGPKPNLRSKMSAEERWEDISSSVTTLDVRAMLTTLLDEGVRPSTAARCVTKAASLPKKQVYQLALELSRKEEDS